MSGSSDPDLVKVTEVFLVPSSFLVAALGTADSNPHRALVSLLGLVVSALWWLASREALSEYERSAADAGGTARPRRTRIMHWLPQVFTVGWLASLVAHCYLWTRPLGH